MEIVKPDIMVEEKNSPVAIILPTYNEAGNIEKLISTIGTLKINSMILVIDDSSPDGTANVVKKLQQDHKNISLLNRPSKMGLGTAIRDGFNFILSLPKQPKYIITMDSDFSHNPWDIPRLFQHAQKGYELVVGSRYCEEGKVKGWPLSRLIISKIANKMTSALIKLPIDDYTSGFRCYSKEYICKTLPKLHTQTYEIQIETLRQACLQGSKVDEIPIIFENRKKGKSKLTITEIVAFSQYILKITWKRFFKKEH